MAILLNRLAPPGAGELLPSGAVGPRIDLAGGQLLVEQLLRVGAPWCRREEPGHRPHHDGDQQQPAAQPHAAAVTTGEHRAPPAAPWPDPRAVNTHGQPATWRSPKGNDEGLMKRLGAPASAAPPARRSTLVERPVGPPNPPAGCPRPSVSMTRRAVRRPRIGKLAPYLTTGVM